LIYLLSVQNSQITVKTIKNREPPRRRLAVWPPMALLSATEGDKARIVALHVAGQSLSKIAVQFEIGKGAVHAIVKSAKMAAQAPAPTMPAKPATATRMAVQAPAPTAPAKPATATRMAAPAPAPTTPAKPSKAARKPAAGGVGDKADMGQAALPAAPASHP
jgi:hypothetical protein